MNPIKNKRNITHNGYGSLLVNGDVQDDTLYTIVDDTPCTKISSAWTEPTVELNYDDIFKKMVERFNRVPTIEHKCHNCGGTLEMRADEHIFKCPYCKSCYAIGTAQINYVY